MYIDRDREVGARRYRIRGMNGEVPKKEVGNPRRNLRRSINLLDVSDENERICPRAVRLEGWLGRYRDVGPRRELEGQETDRQIRLFTI